MSKFQTTHHNKSKATSGKSQGSIYDLLPNILETVKKPSNDDILRKIHESTRCDKDVEWQMRPRYEGRGGPESMSLKSFLLGHDDEKNGALVGLLKQQQHSSRRMERGNGWRGEEKCREYVNGNVKVKPTLSHTKLFYGFPEENALEKIGRRNFIRERCVRKGGVYGPEAIEAVGGPGITKSIIMGGAQGGLHSARSTMLPVGDVYDQNPGVLLWSSSRKVRSPQNNWESSSVINSARNYSKKQHGSNLSARETLQPQHRSPSPPSIKFPPTNMTFTLNKTTNNDKDSANIPSESTATTNNSMNKRDIPPKNFYLPKKLTNLQITNSRTTGVGKVNVEIGVPFRRSSSVHHGRMKMPKGLTRMTKRKKGRSITRKKSVPKNRTKDTRHRGPKIEGINWKHDSKVFGGEEEQPKIRTVVLPFPQKKYRHLM